MLIRIIKTADFFLENFSHNSEIFNLFIQKNIFFYEIIMSFRKTADFFILKTFLIILRYLSCLYRKNIFIIIIIIIIIIYFYSYEIIVSLFRKTADFFILKIFPTILRYLSCWFRQKKCFYYDLR